MPARAIEIAVRAALPLLWCVMVSVASAQMATITGVNVVSGTNQVRVEVTAQGALTPKIVSSREERQIELEFTNTVAELPAREFSINSNGVERVWVTVDRTHGISKVSVALLRKQQFSYSREGAKVVLTIVPRTDGSETARSNKSAAPQNGAPTAASGPWINSLSRAQKEPAFPPSTSASANSAGQGRGTGQQTYPSIPAASSSGATSSSTYPNGVPNSVTVSIENSQPPKVMGQNPNSAASTTVGFSSAAPAATAKAAPPSSAAKSATANTASTSKPANVTSIVASTPPTGTASGNVVASVATPAVAQSPALVQPAASVQSPAVSAAANAVPTRPSSGTVGQPDSSVVAIAPANPPQTARSTQTVAVESTAYRTVNATAPRNDSVTETADKTEPAADTADNVSADQVAGPASVGNLDLRTAFRVKYVADGAAYLDGGSTSGLAEGVKLVIRDPAPAEAKPGQPAAPVVVAELQVVSVAQSSSVTDIHNPKREVKPGDLAYLTSADAEALVQQRALSSTRAYPQVITFTEGDPADEEAREEVPRPPLPEVNRARGRIGFEYSSILSHGAVGMNTSELGLVLRSDITRIGGSYWNLSGYWRGRLESQGSSSQQTLQDLMNRTYHLSLTYDNPKSPWVAGVGRMFLPWASSLETIDGGYFGRKLSSGVTAGIFAGSTPDPTSWSYNPNQRLAGTFVNFEGGSYDAFRYTSTSGLGVSMIHWNVDRPFVFFENGLFYKRFLSIYDSLQIDHPSPTANVPNPGTGISRSYLTVRVQPIERLSLDFNHNYFRDIPTFDLALVGTGLLDKVLFQGFSVGARLEVVKKIYLYTDQGISNRSGDTKNSMNHMYGVSWADIWHSGVRADLRYSQFDSTFAQGSYKAIAISRNFRENFRWEVQAGKQAFVSPLSTDTGSKFLNMSLDTDFGGHYFLMGGWTMNRGIVQNYDQWYMTLGYRFDNRWKNTTK